MRRAISSVIGLLGGIILAGPAEAEMSIVVDKTAQRMTVSVNGQQRYSWPVSTGTSDYSTPVGAFTPSRLARVHYSREWDNAPMPHAIFFTDAGHATHGSRATNHLGTPASHGCVRLAPTHASILFDLVMVEGGCHINGEYCPVLVQEKSRAEGNQRLELCKNRPSRAAQWLYSFNVTSPSHATPCQTVLKMMVTGGALLHASSSPNRYLISRVAQARLPSWC